MRSARELAEPSRKPSVDCDIHVSVPLWNGPLGRDANDDIAAYGQAILGTLKDSGQFSRVLRGKGDGEYYFDVWVGWSKKSDGNSLADDLIEAVQVFSLTVIPTFKIDTCKLIVGVHKGGRFVRAYEYRDSVTRWCQLFMVFASSEKKPRTVNSVVLGNMMDNLLFDLRKDGVL